MTRPSAAMLVIGDEILSGRTRDANLHFLATQLTEHGIDLKEARIVSDQRGAIVAALRALSQKYDHVFTSGGIGPTHDDITAECVAAAFGDKIGVREDARAILQAHYDQQGLELNDARLRMARVPANAALIDNPVSAAPGFTLRNVHVLAGVPKIFEAMVASILPQLTGGPVLQSRSIRIERGEGDVAGPLSAIAEANPTVSLGSYPFQRNGVFGTNIVLRSSDEDQLSTVADALFEAFPGDAS